MTKSRSKAIPVMTATVVITPTTVVTVGEVKYGAATKIRPKQIPNHASVLVVAFGVFR